MVFAATYIEVVPSVSDQAARLLRREQEASRNDEGVLRLEMLQRLDRPPQFLALSGWSSEQALETHRQTPRVVDLNQGLAPMLGAPYDSRQHQALAQTEESQSGAAAITVVTHVDVTPPKKDAAMAALEQLAAESATHQGNYRFFVWQQLDRPNHFTLVETWADRDALEAHGRAAATTAFRRTLAPMLGALYDDRRYRVLD